jgi:hypothetical protein
MTDQFVMAFGVFMLAVAALILLAMLSLLLAVVITVLRD